MAKRTATNTPRPAPTLRFAALIRVSTDRQEDRGESLRTQETQTRKAAEQLGGTVTARYGGQEHATEGFEKQEIERLLADARKKGREWDAVIVSNADRWSRDNQASHNGLEIFRQHGVRFFVTTTEYDLFNPEHVLFLEMSAAFGAFQARSLSKRSLESRAHRARRNIPTSGKLPYGRTFDRETGMWGINPEKQRIIKDVARRYLAGESMAALAREYQMNHASLHKTLTTRCGDTWPAGYNSERSNVHEAVELKVPALLPPETIKAILAKVAANKTYTHGQTKHKYLLGRMVICATCGYAMFGQTSPNGQHTRYYRHSKKRHDRPCNAVTSFVRADDLEAAVLALLFNMFGNPAAVEKAIEQAVPDLDLQRQAQERLAQLDTMIAKEQAGRKQVMQQILRAGVSETEAHDLLMASKEKEATLQGQRQQLVAKMGNAPSVDAIKAVAAAVSSRYSRQKPTRAFMRAHIAGAASTFKFDKMSWDDRRDLCQRVFAGRTPDDTRAGVYISWPDGKKGKIRFTIGGIIETTGSLPMSTESQAYLTNPEYAGQELQDRVTDARTKYAKR